MKKFIAFIILSLVFFSVNAQVVISENFDATTCPSDWYVISQSGNLNWEFGNNVVHDPFGSSSNDFSTNAAIFNDYKNTDNSIINKAWLQYSPSTAIDLSDYNDGNYFLTLDFDYSSYDISSDDKFSVLVRENNTWKTIKENAVGASSVEHKTINLTDWFVNNFSVSFMFDDVDGSVSDAVGVDNVVVKISPKNDSIKNAFEMLSFPYSQHLDATGATNNDGCIDFGGGNGTNDGVWYKINGDGANYQIDVSGTNWNPELSIFTGTPDNLVYLNSIYAVGTSSLSFVSEKNTTYYINVANNNESADGPEGIFDISVSKSCEQLTINTQAPANLYGCESGSVTIYVEASGSGLNYAWKKDGVFMLFAPNAPTYELSNLTQSSEGNYTYYITDACENNIENIFSSTAVRVDAPVIITTQPSDVCAFSGDNTSLEVIADGEELTYNWYFNTDIIQNQNSSTLDLSNLTVDNSGNYQVMISNLGCGSVTSLLAIVNVYDAPLEITQQPQSQSLNSGDNASFSVDVNLSNTSLTYKWYKNGIEISNNNTNQLNLSDISTSDAGNYTVDVSTDCETVTSDVADLTVAGTSALNSLENENLKIYPNPVKNYLNIENDKIINAIIVRDITGKQIFSETENNRQVKLDLSFLESGVYIINVSSENKNEKMQFIKQ